MYNSNETTFIWSPYAMTHTWLNHERLIGRGARNQVSPVGERPYMVGWISANCQDHRARLFQALLRGAQAAGYGDSVHAMGGCEHNRDWSDSEEYPPRGLKPWQLYKKYRWVLAGEGGGLVS